MKSKYITIISILFLFNIEFTISTFAQNSLDLSTLDGFNHGFYITGASFGDKIGNSLSAGDINGDGIDDLIIGAPSAFSGGATAGNTYVIYGVKGKIQTPFSVNQLDGTNGFVIYGDVQADNMGHAVASGDFNGDGLDDIIIGAPLADPFGTQTGEVYVLLSDKLDGSSTYTINGVSSSLYYTIFGSASTAIDNVGESIAVGDVNFDGYDDILIGAPNADTDANNFAGKAYLVYGYDIESLGFLDVNLPKEPPVSTTFFGSSENNFLGGSVHIGNLTGGPSDEVIIGAVSAGSNGKVYVVNGLSTDTFTEDEYDIENTATFIFEGDSTGNVGRSNSISSGDVNGDGQEDLILTANFDGGSNAGRVYVILNTVAASMNPSDLNGTNGFIIKGGIDNERVGNSVKTDDINNDGIDDIILGAYSASPDGKTNAGKTYVLFGKNTGFSSEIDITNISSEEGFVLNGNTSNDQNGFSLASGDFNGDGYNDIASGSPFDAFTNGRVYVFTNTNLQLIKGDEGFRMLSNPSTGKVLSNTYDSFATQGFLGSDVPEADDTNMLNWDVQNQQWQSIDSLRIDQSKGDGILFYTFADDNFDGADDPFPKLLQSPASFFKVDDILPNTGTVNAVENLPQGDFQLIGNPYGKTINWNASSEWSKTNVSETIYIWSDSASNNNGAWLNWNGTTGSLGSGYISSFQSFFVQAQGGIGSLSFNEDVIEGTSKLLKSENDSVNYEIILELTNDEQIQRLYLSFQDEAMLGTDRFDGSYLTPLSESYLSFAAENSSGDLVTLNALPSELDDIVEIPLFLKSVNTSSIAALRVTKLFNADNNWSYYLKDHELNEVYDLSSITSQQISISENSTGESYRYSIQIVPGTQTSNEENSLLPNEISLAQNYPNPFNPSTSFSYNVPETMAVQLIVYDMLGREIAVLVNGTKQAGRYEIIFNASNLSSGVYFYSLKAGTKTLINKMTLIK